MTYTNLSGYKLNQLAMAGKISVIKTEKVINGFYCGTWYTFKTLTGQEIKTVYVPSGFGI